MRKFWQFEADGSILDVENPCLSSFGLTELVVPAIASVLGSVGIGASTAGGIASVLGPSLVQAGVGAGLGALTGQPGTGALLGAVNGGMGPLSQALGMGSNYGTQAVGALNAASGIPGGASPVTITPAANDLSVGAGNAAGATGAGMPMGATGTQMGAGQSPLAASSGNIAGGLRGPLAILAALAQNANRPSTDAPTPSGFNEPFTPGGVNRTPTPGYAPTGSWYTYGQSSNPEFFQGNQVHFARGGALSRGAAPFKTGGGEHYLHGEDGGQDDTVDAKLSDGEFVMDAGTVSKLGDGNSNAGARRMEIIRRAIDEDTDAKGVVQRKARSPLHYAQQAQAA